MKSTTEYLYQRSFARCHGGRAHQQNVSRFCSNIAMEWFCERAIRSPKSDQAEVNNDKLLKSLEGEEMTLTQ